MIANRHRGEITATLDGRKWLLCLTLGALAEVESGLGEADITSLVNRFSSGKLSARDMRVLIAAGLRGGGHDIDDTEVDEMRSEGGLTGYAKIVAELLEVTFFDPGDKEPNRTNDTENPPLPQK